MQSPTTASRRSSTAARAAADVGGPPAAATAAAVEPVDRLEHNQRQAETFDAAFAEFEVEQPPEILQVR